MHKAHQRWGLNFGPMRNPDRPHGREKLLKAFANLRRTVQWIPLRVSSESMWSPRIDLRSSVVALHRAMKHILMSTTREKLMNNETAYLNQKHSVQTLAQKRPWRHWDTAEWRLTISREGWAGRDLPHIGHTPSSSPDRTSTTPQQSMTPTVFSHHLTTTTVFITAWITDMHSSATRQQWQQPQSMKMGEMWHPQIWDIIQQHTDT